MHKESLNARQKLSEFSRTHGLSIRDGFIMMKMMMLLFIKYLCIRAYKVQ